MPRITKIFGPPGTGKTTWMLNKLDQELTNVALHRIAYVTFSVAAREEAKGRAQARLTAKPDEFRYFRTIHGICYAEAHLSASNVMQVEDYLDFSKKTGIKFSDDFSDEFDIDSLPVGWGLSVGNKVLNIRQVASARQIAPLSEKCRLLDWPRDVPEREIKHILCEYAKYKDAVTKFDFVDMLEMYSSLGEPLPIDVMFIDEAQDLSALQWALVKQMSLDAQRVYIAGDDDQSIYGFLGADPMGFFHHECDEKVMLTKSYRLRQNIWDYASSIINPVKEREQKIVEVRDAGGQVESWNRPVEEVVARIGSEDGIMVVAHANHSLAGLASTLERSGVPVRFKGKSITGSDHANTVYDYHKVRGGEPIPIRAAIRILRLIKGNYRQLSETARMEPSMMIDRDGMVAFGVDFSRAWTDYLSAGTRFRAVNDKLRQIGIQGGMDAIIQQPKVELTTYHASKGREAHTVILATDCSPAAFEHAVRDPDNERRVAYVGVTRARERLIKIAPQTAEYIRALQ